MKRKQSPRIKFIGHPWKFYDEDTLITQLPSRLSVTLRNSSQINEALQAIEDRGYFNHRHRETSVVSPMSDLADKEPPLEHQVRSRNSRHAKLMIPKVEYSESSMSQTHRRQFSSALPSLSRGPKPKSYNKPWYISADKWKQVKDIDKELQSKKMSSVSGTFQTAANTYQFLQTNSEAKELEKYAMFREKFATMPVVGQFKQ